MSSTLIEFQDNGQDFLVWLLNQDGVVVRSWPYQTDVWGGTKVTNLKTLKRDGIVKAEFHGRPWVCRHAVAAVHPVQPVDVSVKWDGIAGYVTSTVRGKRASCTHDCEDPVRRLAERIFPSLKSSIERLECQPVGKVHSLWRITPEGT
ncbi:TPA: hypothetical protein ACGJ4G_002872 [Pseudomonas aeruginosa]|uniref:hypothetical protein n=1 Tax=Pseudomonas aeruginosa TaxID=287 RepID=UPI00295497DE|nr:hypothetical protein [Pseudomonas aeruginosa]EKY1378573.1 hypothetical protein [Pseudomonas aeruginosa]EKY1397479.1 hypothetical protein [Pseudomonas aeruginosa]MDV8137891.1 hypothetical protein [Pseudomonas aeruginosa]HDQ4463688.1 hypothetical protein [Pseudomonas aeruginosa]HDQ4722039.1 hypothetical protein [Pseudomonas aeruginosa]